MITKDNLHFLKQLEKNNNRDWFTENKGTYIQQHQNTIDFADELLELLRKHDRIENESGKKSLMRIYRDVRFSKDKSPYKTNWGLHFKRATKSLRGGYYVHIKPGECFVGGGFWGPESSDLKLIRDGIVSEESTLRKILKDKTFVQFFGADGLHGESLKNVPKGYDKESSAADLLQLKQYLIKRDFSDQEVFSADFIQEVNRTFIALRPFFDFMSYHLTHDANGEPLV